MGNVNKILKGRALPLKVTFIILGLAFISACVSSQVKKEPWQRLSPGEAVQKRIALDSRLEGTEITVRLNNGVSTLTGEVNSFGQKLIAQEDLYEVKGVRKVVNNLIVRPSEIPDEKIANSILESFPKHCLVETQDIKVNVKDGNVILTGQSEKFHHKDVIMNIAIFTRGVRSVNNQIVVLSAKGKSKTTDLWVKKNVEGILWSMLTTDTHNIDIEVIDGEVTLSGIVESAIDSRRIVSAVHNVPGVTGITNGLSLYEDAYIE